ncbi:Methyl-accepting chemotaxis protein II [Curvibacter sp. AEP1-3]|uniref:methyl-accepting chemotaxis protein n=1 Tax=Curvibacter sp. AEP1-3 TaxID=1844971 RepID=UPI000B3CDDB4|nr:methyl-accepting chemotaxis protein [Curvibacter sp. AEP1-3]ARV19447.1 Methyl-accepting chemotaxis protein II [Curvibacter sp. AEP1-3]
MNMMTMMRQFTIRLRMLGAIAMVLALLFMLGGGGLWGMGKIQDQSDAFLDNSFAEMQHLGRLQAAMSTVREAEKDMIIEYERPAEVEKAYTRWKSHLAEVDAIAGHFLEGVEDTDNPVVREMQADLKEYVKLFEPVANQLKSSGYESATIANRMSQKALGQIDKVMKHMKSLEGVLQDEANDAVNDQHKVSGVIKWLFIAALGVASLVVVPLTILNMNSICQPLERARLLAQAIAGGDLSQAIEVHGKDEVADLQHAQKAMQEGLGALVSQVRYASESVATASQEIASGNQDLSERTEKSASSVQDTVGSLAELTENVQQTAHAAQTARQLSDSAFTLAARGGQVVTQAVSSMHEIAASSSKINDIIGLIDSIAFQTNILALNAAVEAARAGEQGRGFAVVASEVRMLAKRSAAAAQEIKALVSTSVHAVDGGVKLVEEAGAAMKEMVDGVQRVGQIIGEISSSATEQSSGIAQVNQSVGMIDQATQQNAALVEQSAAAAQGLREQADALAQVVRQFRLKGSAA